MLTIKNGTITVEASEKEFYPSDVMLKAIRLAREHGFEVRVQVITNAPENREKGVLACFRRALELN